MKDSLQRDNEHLRLLVTFHYVVAALIALFSSIFIIHVIIGITAIVSPQSLAGKSGTPPPAFFGWLFTIMGGVAVLFGWAVSICLILAGRFLARREHYSFCFVIAAVSCIFMPFGTVLGIFSIIVLLRPTVKEQFKQQ